MSNTYLTHPGNIPRFMATKMDDEGLLGHVWGFPTAECRSMIMHFVAQMNGVFEIYPMIYNQLARMEANPWD